MPEKLRTSAVAGDRLRAVHPVLPLTFVILSFGIAGLLVPSRHELAQRLFKDGSHLRAMQATLDIDGAADPANAAEVDRRQAEDALTRVMMDPAQLPAFSEDAHGRLLLADGIVAATEPQTKLMALAQISAGLPTEDREQLLRAIAVRALDRGLPALAGLVFNQLVQLRPEAMSPEMLREVVRSWRANSQPTEALSSLEIWMQSAKASGEVVAPDLQELRLGLLLETDQAPRALDLLLARLDEEQAGGGLTQATLERATEAAGYCGRIIELRRHAAAYLAAHPLGRASLAEIGAAMAAPNAPLVAERTFWMHLAGDLAQWCEWSEASEEALAYYEKLAVLGDPTALHRAVEIGGDLGKGESLLVVLDLVMTRPGNEIYARSYAQLLGLAGRLEEASKHYGGWLASHTGDIEACAEYAALCEERDDLEAALIAWKRVADLQPDNAEYRKREAEVCLDLKRDQEALALYLQITPAQHDSTSLENLALVAESLGEYQALNKALLWRFERLEHPHTPDFLELARSFSLTGRTGDQLEYLRRGLGSLPQSLTLRRQLASALQDVERDLEAVEVLEVASTKSDLRSMCLYISSATRSDQYMRAATFLKEAIATRKDFPAETRLDLGHICYHAGRYDEARKFYASVDSNAATWPLLAQACYQLGSFAEAEKYQRQYLGEMDAVPVEQLIFLGDICRASGKEDEADIAYNQALESIRSKHEADLPPPPAPKVSASGVR